MGKTNQELREIAKDTLMESIASAYYRLENESYTEEENHQICKYIEKYGKSMAKAIRKEFYTM